MMQFKTIIIQAYLENFRSAEKTWNILEFTLPALKKVMKKNTFKQYLTVLIPFNAELDKMNDKTLRIQKDFELLQEKHNRLSNLMENEKNKVRQKTQKVRQRLDNCKKISGWNIRKSNDGYYRCYRKINRKVQCIYIGKKIDKDKVSTLIAEKERHLIKVRHKLDINKD